ncbi:hypothetical protein BGZ61DRAFT_573826, partial [Ilyonectria robusta]|uniref:uncharacterized protein n=1 Tax=Ilyonectria robusta TaxID=1079257 RepID=UPI001E8E95DB
INPRVYIHSTPVEYILHPLCNCLKNRTSTLLGPKWSGCSGSDPWLKAQSCDDSRASTVWYTCQGHDPPFMGCCDVSPCSQGCTRDNLLPTILSTKKANRNAFLDPESVYSSTVATSSATASASASASSSADSDDGGGLSHGAMAPWRALRLRLLPSASSS